MRATDGRGCTHPSPPTPSLKGRGSLASPTGVSFIQQGRPPGRYGTRNNQQIIRAGSWPAPGSGHDGVVVDCAPPDAVNLAFLMNDWIRGRALARRADALRPPDRVRGQALPGLRESHKCGMICQHPTLHHGIEPLEASSHGLWSGGLVSLGGVAGPSAEPCGDPGVPGQRGRIVRVLQFFGSPLQRGADRLQCRRLDRVARRRPAPGRCCRRGRSPVASPGSRQSAPR